MKNHRKYDTKLSISLPRTKEVRFFFVVDAQLFVLADIPPEREDIGKSGAIKIVLEIRVFSVMLLYLLYCNIQRFKIRAINVMILLEYYSSTTE